MDKILKNYTIAFDLDGTLVDTAPDLVRATNEILDILELPHVEEDAMRKIVGRGARISIERAAGLFGKELSKETVDFLLPKFLASYEAGIANKSRIYEGVETSLELLASAGAKLVVCTNKPTHLAKLVLTELKLIDRFEGVYGPETTPRPKPDPIHLIKSIEGIGGDIKRAFMIGDSENDVLAAQSANVQVFVTSFGYTTKKASDLGADAFFNHFDELFELIIANVIKT